MDDAVERARLRWMLERPDGERISDEVIDQLLAGARTEAEIAGPEACWRSYQALVERAMEVELPITWAMSRTASRQVGPRTRATARHRRR